MARLAVRHAGGQIVALSGVTSGPLTLVADSGSYITTGYAAGINFGTTLTASTGTYATTGNDATLRVNRRLVAENGSYALTGYPVVFAGQVVLDAQSGSYSTTGNDAGLRRNRRFSAESGSYTSTGHAANLLASRLIAANAGAYSTTGNVAALTFITPRVQFVGSISTQNIPVNLPWNEGFSPYFEGTLTPITYSIIGTLPTGLTLNSSTGVISGTPTVIGTTPIQIRATDNDSNTADSNSFSILVNDTLPLAGDTRQGAKIAGWAFEAGVSPQGYNAMLLQAAASAGFVTGTANERMIRYLQDKLSSSTTDLTSLQREAAVSLGYSRWSEVGDDIRSL